MGMSEAAIMGEFPFVAEMPKRERSRYAQMKEQFAAVKAIVEEKGMIVPVQLAAKMAGLSNQRIRQLIDSDRLEVVRLDGHVYVTEDSLVELLSSERKAGRPSKFMQEAEEKGPLKAAIQMFKEKKK